MSLRCAAPVLALLSLASTLCLARPQTPPVIHVGSDLVTIDVLAEDKKTGEPVSGLRQDDFQVHDNGKAVDITTFNHGQAENLRPIQLWFVLLCNEERHYPVGGSRRHTQAESTEIVGATFLAGKASSLLATGLEHLAPGETVGVAHWCDNGESEIDVNPTTQHDVALKAVDALASRKTVVVEESADVPDGQARVLRMINDVSRAAFPPPVAAIVFIGAKRSAVDAAPGESGSMDFSSLDFGLESAPGASGDADSQYSVEKNQYGHRLGMIIEILHNRYEIGFLPSKKSKKWNRVSVGLTPEAKAQFPNALLRYRAGYMTEASADALEAAKSMKDWKQLDSKMQAAVKSDASLKQQLSFNVFPSKPLPAEQGQPKTERLLLRFGKDDLTWRMLPNGDRRCVITAVVVAYSAKGRPVSVVVKDLEVIQAFDKLPKLKDKPLVLAVNAPVAKGAVKIRVVVRDVATGYMGSQDLQPVAGMFLPSDRKNWDG